MRFPTTNKPSPRQWCLVRLNCGSHFAVSSFASHACVCMSFEMATTIVMMKAALVHHFVVGSRPTAANRTSHSSLYCPVATALSGHADVCNPATVPRFWPKSDSRPLEFTGDFG